MEENKNNISMQSGDIAVYAPEEPTDDPCVVPVYLVTSDGSSVDNTKVTTKTTCTDLTTDIVSVVYEATGDWYAYVGSSKTTTELNLTVVFSLDGYEPITWTGKTAQLYSATTTLTFEKIKTLSDEITRIKTAKESLRTALNTLVPKMVGDDLSLDYYGDLIKNVIRADKVTIRAITQITTTDSANSIVASARKLKQPLIVWFPAGNSQYMQQGCVALAKLNYAACYGAMFCYLTTSWDSTTFGPIDLTKCTSASLIFIDPECPDTEPITGVDYSIVSTIPSDIDISLVQSGLGQLATIAGRL